ncbi:ABC transporter ATP-binding protein [Saccharopolyspora phatthalungensis]|uniref:Phospholipid/cholesterol/gamma-HCH transport system ATP-binding protein n=1 Tax=Saccharopolyspora phatthalungensis TaxID=664693 RepID=A0A840Q408_9PSEU|nr:ABC transporter ATP-binding protein [Saccharopolyspora phatthalungensis]MBB5154717.1 phospholipid/cholesterol/gamma-HCH transport system ATP-binding protein [Saccharopolyspora phatthalungensis]
MGVEVVVDGLSKSFGAQTIWRDVTLTLPPGEISVLLGPSGTGKSVFLKSLVGLLKPESGRVVINGVDICTCSERKLYEIRKLFGVLFQDGALFGSMNLYDNIAFPLREHTRKSEAEIRNVVLEKMEMVGLLGAEEKVPGEISGGMRKRAGLARALVLDPEIILFDEPDSGLDPVRTALLNQLIVDLNAQIDATFLIVTHDINTARTVPDNIGMLFSRNLVMFGPREVLLTSTEPVVEQFLNGRPQGPIGMSEEKDAAQAAAELAQLRGADLGVPQIMPQLEVTPGLPDRTAVGRRKDRVLRQLHTLAPAAQQEILKTLTPEELARCGFAGPATGVWPQRTEPVQVRGPGWPPAADVAEVPQRVRPSPRPRQPEPAPAEPPWHAGYRPEPAEQPRRRWFGRKRGEP